MAAPYPISAGILPALPEYDCHCSPVTTDKLVACHSQKSRRHLEKPPFWMHPDLWRGEERPRLAKSPHPTGPPLTAAFAPPRPLTLRDGSGSSCPITAIVYGQSRRLQWRGSSHSFLARCVEGSTARARTELEGAPACASARNAGTPTSDRYGLSRSAPRRHPPGVTRLRCRQAIDTLARVLPGLRPSSR